MKRQRAVVTVTQSKRHIAQQEETSPAPFAGLRKQRKDRENKSKIFFVHTAARKTHTKTPSQHEKTTEKKIAK